MTETKADNPEDETHVVIEKGKLTLSSIKEKVRILSTFTKDEWRFGAFLILTIGGTITSWRVCDVLLAFINTL